MVEYITAKRQRVGWAPETSYGVLNDSLHEGTGSLRFIGVLNSYETRRDVEVLEIEAVDSETKDVNELFVTTRQYGATWQFNPLHGACLQLAYGRTTGVLNSTSTVHTLVDLKTEQYDVPSFRVAKFDLKVGSSSVEELIGCKVDTIEWTVNKGELVECTLEIVAKDVTAVAKNAEPTAAWATSTAGQYYYIGGSVSPSREPFMWNHGHVYINGNKVTGVLTVRWRKDENLLVDYSIDGDTQGFISEPVPQRRRYEFEVTARMSSDDYRRMFYTAVLNVASATLGTYTAAVTMTVASSDVSFDFTGIATVPPVGILKADDGAQIEWMVYVMKDNVAQLYRGSTVLGYDKADLTGASVEFYGTLSWILNKSSAAVDALTGAAMDLVCFAMWGGRIKTFADPIDVGGDIVEQTFLIQPTKCVPIIIDDVDTSYI